MQLVYSVKRCSADNSYTDKDGVVFGSRLEEVDEALKKKRGASIRKKQSPESTAAAPGKRGRNPSRQRDGRDEANHLARPREQSIPAEVAGFGLNFIFELSPIFVAYAQNYIPTY
ncbi:hypothetical protein PIB30_068485 [Stylosanthes scabra]|uniref:Uncharacterized protein n=1 Tax=Stylosanthes scabra TaxID=79078 RepID=A0ABU6QP16_9FABA|nr:hypothetical protein [Stylosanthes scabra]